MSCITELLKIKGDKDFLPVCPGFVIEGGGSYKGYEYLITFTGNGSRCGYIALHPNKKYNVHEISCHGGITFEDPHHGAKDLLSVPCDDTWIGFDTAHDGDLRCFDTARKYFADDVQVLNMLDELERVTFESSELEKQFRKCTHKSYEYMEEECKDIINQLIEDAE